jgi:hypothetical protein
MLIGVNTNVSVFDGDMTISRLPLSAVYTLWLNNVLPLSGNEGILNSVATIKAPSDKYFCFLCRILTISMNIVRWQASK